jgi:hypothetical protein
LRKILSLAGILLVGVLALGASTASAGEVRWFGGCWHQDSSGHIVGGTGTTAAGALTVSFGWATNSIDRTQKFLDYQYITYSVNGGPDVHTAVGDKTGWSAITQGTDPTGQAFYSSRWTSPALATLASGESATIVISLKAEKTIWDDDKTSYKAGTELLGPATHCHHHRAVIRR